MRYSDVQQELAVRKSLFRRIAGLGRSGDTADTLVIPVIETFYKLPASLPDAVLVGFEAMTSGIRYTGGQQATFLFNGVSTVGVNVNNTIVHFKLAINDRVIDRTESSVKLDSVTMLSTINATAYVTLNPGDEISVYAKADKTCTISSYHMQLTFMEV